MTIVVGYVPTPEGEAALTAAISEARLRNLSHVDPQRVEVSVVEHLRMCDALLAGDADEVATAIAEHLARSVETIFRNLAALPGSGLDLLG